ncbi:KpsF/GutQ family sugar-phosphate isomerase [Sedimentisphaera salicampi]|uniref:KpsF/GutQ family sugar-phosphate isomerase n=1 Tax=Sedimentisphaera salicampi TaxID=1941349 RepID=UPI000B9B04E7|nr:KpsF/GutQ family sugar-phosphate isomerase [Sedimentisphaera salicampi]OXU15356.1 Arabinose 5-phosphate isomerase KdsD [Sedimentisphaera salicampi]
MKFDAQYAQQVIKKEAQAVDSLSELVSGGSFALACEKIYNCKSNVVVSGIGKAGLIGRKISATMASVGIPSIFLHPSEAVHGDLGRVCEKDLAVLISYGGKTAEMLRLMQVLKQMSVQTIALTGKPDSSLAANCDVSLAFGSFEEACPLGLAPTVSTTCMLAVGDALALTVMKAKKFTKEDFAKYHPGGSLGAQLITVEQSMDFTKTDKLPIVEKELTIADMLDKTSSTKRRGAVMVAGKSGRLEGIITDADLRRLFMDTKSEGFSRTVESVMTANCKYVQTSTLASEAMAIFHKYRIDELPVVDEDLRPVGMIDVQDIVSIKLSR